MKIAARILLIWAALDVVAAYFWYRFMDRVRPPKPKRSHASSRMLTFGE